VSPKPDDWLLVGRVIAPFGIRGEVKIRLHTDYPERFTKRPLYVGVDHAPFIVTSWRSHGPNVAVPALQNVATRDAAEALRDADLFANADDSVPLPEGEYYVHDLVGLTVVTDGGRVVGTVADVMATGSNDVYVVKSTDGRELLIPAIKDVVDTIDLSAQRLVIHEMDGLDL